MMKKQRSKRSGALYFVGLLLFIQVSAIFLQAIPARALVAPDAPSDTPSPYSQDSVTDRAINWVLARAVEECLDSNGVQSKDDPNNITQGDITAGEYVGRIVEGTSSNDGQVDCDPIWKAAHQALGWSTTDTVCITFKFTRERGECAQGSGNYNPPANTNFGDEWNNLFRAKYLGGLTINNSLTDGMRYFIYFGDFKEKCGNDQGASGFKRYDWSGQNTSKDSDYHLQWYTNGEVVDSYVVADKNTKGWDVHISGYKTLDNKGDNNDIIKCKDLASNINAYADAFKKELATDKTAGRSQTSLDTAGTSADNNGGGCFKWSNPISWLLCPGVKILSEMVQTLDGLVQDQLLVPDDKYKNDAITQLWQVMRNIAFLILVPMMIFMVIGTALEIGPFDAYTVRKALPRMLIAVMFIPLSLPICYFLIKVSNVVGQDIGNIIVGVAQQANLKIGSLNDLYGPVSGGTLTLTAGAAVAGGIATETLTVPLIGSLALVAVAGLLIGYFTLVIRQLLILVMIFLAPIAILVWIFPGNDKLWKVWRTTFIALLMMFPLIMLLIYSGKLFAGVLNDTGGGPAEFILKTIIYVAPYFFIPATFRAGMGAFGAVTGAINDRSRGFFDKQKKKREGLRAEGWNNFKTGGGSRNILSRSAAASRVGQGIGVGIRGRGGFGQRGQGAMDLMSRVSQADRLKDPRMQQLAYDDDANAAMYLSGGSEAKARERLSKLFYAKDNNGNFITDSSGNKVVDTARIDRAVGTAKQIGISRANSLAAVQSGAQNKFRAIWESPDAMELIRDSVTEASGGDAANSQLVDNTMGNVEFLSRQAGNYHLGASDANAPGGANLESAWKKAGLYQHANGTGQSMEAFGKYHVDKFKNGNVQERQKAAIALLEMQNMLPSATGENQGKINDALKNAGIDFNLKDANGDTLSVAKQIYEKGRVAEGPEPLSLQDLTGRARVYDREDERVRRTE